MGKNIVVLREEGKGPAWDSGSIDKDYSHYRFDKSFPLNLN